jgi:hypothetical protein
MDSQTFLWVLGIIVVVILVSNNRADAAHAKIEPGWGWVFTLFLCACAMGWLAWEFFIVEGHHGL